MHEVVFPRPPRPEAALPAAGPADRFLADVLEGLGRRRKSLPCKYFYDKRGSELFDEICTLDEYYPTRTETALLHRHAAEIAEFCGPGATLLELGSGSSVKVRALLDALDEPAAYMPVDISGEHLRVSATRLAADYPKLAVEPICADYVAGFTVPQHTEPGRTLAFFPGSTIGNFTPDEAQDFLRRLGRQIGADGKLLIGVDLKKSKHRLEAAYDDARGVTAAFNLNLLARINRELDGTFDVGRFAHRAFYCIEQGRIEMHLESLTAQIASVSGTPFQFFQGETIHTEVSYKYSIGEFKHLTEGAGWRTLRTWSDADALFSVHLLTCG